jgi:RNA polymerase sigma factor (sigma-70 family)
VSPNPLARLPRPQSDKRLLELAREGDERAFETVVRRYRRALLRYCRRLGLSEPRAEDAVQQALLQAWLAIERGRDVHAPRAWLYRAVHNSAVTVLRSSPSELVPEHDGARLAIAPSAESEFERRIALRETLGDLAALPDMQREAILLTAVDGRSHEEAASALGLTDGAVRGLIYRARATLRNAAAAVLPPPALAWAGGWLGRLAPAGDRLAQTAAPGGGAEMGGFLMKGAALAASTAALTVGAGVVSHSGQRHPSHTAVAAAGVPAMTADAQPPVGATFAPQSARRAASSQVRGSSSAPGAGRPRRLHETGVSGPHTRRGDAGRPEKQHTDTEARGIYHEPGEPSKDSSGAPTAQADGGATRPDGEATGTAGGHDGTSGLRAAGGESHGSHGQSSDQVAASPPSSPEPEPQPQQPPSGGGAKPDATERPPTREQGGLQGD